ncbi:MAG: SusC/RagA family TonB-linked outer membrane protein [Saprospiraceae bacterium]|nr:SusC/RagA family TonB-linked outer membrane protein [Saprospiraceae bacterium]
MKFLNTVTKGGALLAFLLLLSNFALAQRTVKGKVSDAESGEGLIGATVSVVGTTRGASTDIDGNFSVEVPDGATQLRFAYTGYAEQVVALSASNSVDVALKPGTMLDEVVVIGYGSVRKTDATGAVASVTDKDFNKGVIVAPEQLMQGRVAGVQITNSNGEPGGGINVRIRGTSSVRSGNNPLFVVDGVPLSGGDTGSGGADAGFGSSAARNPLNFLNPADIATMDVLKDASATAIYGSRGANGVVIITTKKGATGKGSLSYDYSLGISTISKKYDLLDGPTFLSEWSKRNPGVNPNEVNGKTNTDWQDQIFRTALTNSHNISYGGSANGGDYRFSFGYQNQEGIIRESGLTKYTARFNGNKKFINDRLNIGTQITIANNHDDNVPISNNSGFQGDLLGMTLKANPTDSVYRANGKHKQKGVDNANPVALLELSKDFTKTLRALGNLSAEYSITKNLSFKTVLGFDQSLSTRKTAYSRDLVVNTINTRGRLFLNDVESENRLWENYFTYTKSFNNANLSAVLGYSYQSFEYVTRAVEMTNFRVSDLDNMINNYASSNQDLGTSIIGRNSSSTIDELQSYFGRVNLGFADKYLFTATLRADGSTRFGGDNKYGYFPAAAFKWRLIDEGFVPDVFSDLGLRLGYGVTGNQEIPNNLYQNRQRFNDWDINDDGNDINGGGIGDVTFNNPGLKWESTKQLGLGVDFAFMDGRIAGSLDLYKKNTSDLLILVTAAQPAPQPFFFTNLDADVQNSGVELSLNIVAVDKANLRWNVLLNGAYNKNEVKKYDGLLNTGAINGQGLSGAFAQRIAQGQPLFAFYVRDFAGYDSEGLSIYNGGDIQQFIGSPLPTITAGLTNQFTIGNFDASIFLNSQFGNKIYNNTANAYFTAGSLAGARNVSPDVTTSGESQLNSPDVSTRFLENGAFVRIQDVTLGYRVKLKSSTVSSLRFFVTGQNLAVFTDYSGQDPEVNINKAINGVPSFGIDYTPYPRARTILLGASVSF